MQNSFSYQENEVFEIAQSLEGKAAGIQIRGPSNVNQNIQLLILIDGMEAFNADLNSIDTYMVKDITVLKDASSTTIYGTRGASGVLIVTLKNAMDDYVAEADNVMNRTYNIILPYNIPGNGK